MDPLTPPQATPTASPQPAPTIPAPATASTLTSNGGGGKMLVIILVLVLLIAGAGGGAYWWYTNNQTTAEPATTETKDEPKVTPEPAKDTLEAEQKDLDAITVPEVETDFKEVDTDINTL